MAQKGNHLLVFGASGISGWACVKEALSFPTPSTFQKITGLTNRPLSLEDSGLPQDSRIQLVSGIDLTSSVDNVVSLMSSKIQDIDSVTHVIFTAYIEKPDFETLRTINSQILATAVDALEKLSPAIQSIVLQTGGKAYGVEFSDKLEINPPLKESEPRIPKPYYDNIFYYFQHDILKEKSASKTWTFSEVRPDVIVGATVTPNFMNVCQGLGLWLSLAREVKGSGAEIPFPGTLKSWQNKHTDTFQDILGRMDIYAAVNHDKCGNGGTFNCANGDLVTWSDKWPGICKYFDLVGTPPGKEPYSIEAFVKENMGTWDKIAEEHGLKKDIMEKFSWPFLYFVMTVFDFDRQYDLSAAKAVGFGETIDTVKGFSIAFDRMRAAKNIP